MRRLWLIAAREFFAYTRAGSFWVALLGGPLVMGLAALLLVRADGAGREPPARAIAVHVGDPALSAVAVTSLREAAGREGWRLEPAGEAKPATTLTLTRSGSAGLTVTVAGEPLSPLAEALLRRDLGRAAADDNLRRAGVAPRALAEARVEVNVKTAPRPPAPAGDMGAPGRFALMMLLWMNLVGAMGMLMQAVVRERANRALESLLAAARPGEVLFGKLFGVGAVSVLVLAGWAGGAAVLGAAADGSGGARAAGVVQLLLSAWREPALLAQAGLVYALAFVMFGSALVGLGAMARDLPAAQNLARPVFAVLLMVFFAALARSGPAGASLDGLLWIPPFTPFMLLLAPPESLGVEQRVAALLLLAMCAAVTAAVAPWSLQDRPRLGRAKSVRSEAAA